MTRPDPYDDAPEVLLVEILGWAVIAATFTAFAIGLWRSAQ